MSFFKTKLRGFGCGPRFGARGCGRGELTAEQKAERRDRMVERMTSKLLLNAEQKQLAAKLLDQMAAQRQALVGQTSDMRAEFRSWFAGERFDAARAQTLIHDKTTALQSQSPELLAAMAALFDSLNPAQQQKVRNWMEGPRRWFRRG